MQECFTLTIMACSIFHVALECLILENKHSCIIMVIRRLGNKSVSIFSFLFQVLHARFLPSTKNMCLNIKQENLFEDITSQDLKLLVNSKNNFFHVLYVEKMDGIEAML